MATGTHYYGGYVITDGSTYAPQMPWYMAHYCDACFATPTKDVQDPVCYGDYFSPMNNGFNPLNPNRRSRWPRSVPWSVFHGQHPDHGTTALRGRPSARWFLAGSISLPCRRRWRTFQYKQYNQNLLTWFNEALRDFADQSSNAELEQAQFSLG